MTVLKLMKEKMIIVTLLKMAKNDWQNRSVYTLDILSLFLIMILFTDDIYVDVTKIFFQIFLYQAVKRKTFGEADFIVLLLLSFQLELQKFALLITLSSSFSILYTVLFSEEEKIPFMTCLFFAYLFIIYT